MPGSMQGAPAWTLTPPGRKFANCALRRNGQRLEADDVARAARHVHLAGRDHGGDAAIEVGVDPADLVLARRPVAGDGVHVAVDQARRQCRAVGVDDVGGALLVDVLGAPDGGDAAVLGHHGVGVEDRVLQRAGEQQADVADHQFLGFLSRGLCLVGHCQFPSLHLLAAYCDSPAGLSSAEAMEQETGGPGARRLCHCVVC